MALGNPFSPINGQNYENYVTAGDDVIDMEQNTRPEDRKTFAMADPQNRTEGAHNTSGTESTRQGREEKHRKDVVSMLEELPGYNSAWMADESQCTEGSEEDETTELDRSHNEWVSKTASILWSSV